MTHPPVSNGNYVCSVRVCVSVCVCVCGHSVDVVRVYENSVNSYAPSPSPTPNTYISGVFYDDDS